MLKVIKIDIGQEMKCKKIVYNDNVGSVLGAGNRFDSKKIRIIFQIGRVVRL